jgi:predicted nucleic acid-binding protein
MSLWILDSHVINQLHGYSPNIEKKLMSLQLRQQVRMNRTGDMRIAAIALSVDGIVVTRNQKDFEKVPNLKIEDWTLKYPTT